MEIGVTSSSSSSYSSSSSSSTSSFFFLSFCRFFVLSFFCSFYQPVVERAIFVSLENGNNIYFSDCGWWGLGVFVDEKACEGG